MGFFLLLEMPNILLSGLNYGPKFNSIEHKNKKKKKFKKNQGGHKYFVGGNLVSAPIRYCSLLEGNDTVNKAVWVLQPQSKQIACGLGTNSPPQKGAFESNSHRRYCLL